MSNSSVSSDLIAQISANLANTRSSFGTASIQYQTVLETLRTCIKDEETQRRDNSSGESRDGVEELRLLLEKELNVAH